MSIHRDIHRLAISKRKYVAKQAKRLDLDLRAKEKCKLMLTIARVTGEAIGLERALEIMSETR
jgi:hypothetical protein